jgi:predicted permease
MQDLRFALRLIARNPGLSAVIIVTLALGIGANTAVFSVVDAVLLKPLPYKDSERLVAIWDKYIKEGNLSKVFASYADFEEWKSHSRSFDQIAACTWARAGQTLTGRGAARSLLAIPASVDFFSLLGVPAARGRTFRPDDLNQGCSVVLAHRFWQDALGGEPDIIGKSLALDGKACSVIGVMPAGFAFFPEPTELWTLLARDYPPDVGVFGRLKPGVSMASAQAEISRLHELLHKNDKKEPDVVPVVYDLQGEFTWMAGRNLRLSLLVLLAAVGFVLIIACVNVANLLLGRSLVRRKELAIRAALGSGQTRLIRQLMTEGLLLSSIGAMLGLLLAVFAIRYFQSASPVELPPGNPVTVNTQVLVFTASLSIVTALLFGLLPAWKASRVDVSDMLKAAGHGCSQGVFRSFLAKSLVIAEVALSLVLLAGAGLLMESVLRLGSADLGYRPERLITFRVTLPKGGYLEPEQRSRLYEELIGQAGALPGVQGAAVSSSLPMAWWDGVDALTIEGHPSPVSPVHDVTEQVISPDYFRVMGTPLRSGRVFDARDREDSEQVAIVNEALVRKYFPNESPLGKRVKRGGPGVKSPWLTIVGVTGNEKRTTVYKEMDWVEEPFVFRPVRQKTPNSIAVAIRTAGDPPGLIPAIRRQILSLDSAVVVSDIRSMQERISRFLAYPRFRAVMLGLFSGLALLLAVVGLYGVLAQLVAQRTREIGIRMALGAQKQHVLGLVLRQGMLPIFSGLGLGLVATLALTRYLSSLLYAIRPTDPLALAVVSVTLLSAAFLGAYIPAHRAATLDPMAALRDE